MTNHVAGMPGAQAGQPLPVDRSELVSVLVRSMGRESLARALASVQRQTWRSVEVVVVNASGMPHPPLALADWTMPIRWVDSDQPLPRAMAANRALAAAQGRWLLFLDDDDTLDPDHLTRLCGALRRHPERRVAHTGVRLVDAQGLEQGCLDEAVDAVRLWSANCLAIHAVLFERSLLDNGLQFDESFAVYEDWDFWFQLARQVPFLQVGGVSATYHLVGQSGVSQAHSRAISRGLRNPFYRKWLPQLTVAELEALAASAEVARGDLGSAQRQLGKLHQDAAAQQQLVDGLRARLTAAEADQQCAQTNAQELSNRLAQAGAELAQAGAGLAQAGAKLAQAEDELAQAGAELALRADAMAARDHALQSYAELEAGYQAITQSLSWRLTQPLRSLRHKVSGLSAVSPAHRVWRALPLSNAQRLALRDQVLTRGWGRALARRWAPQVLPAAAAARPATGAFDKEEVRAQAEAALGEFLAGTQRIDLSCADAQPTISVIVVVFNQAGLSRLCLQSLAASQGQHFETLIVDNGSTDRVPQLLERVDGASLIRPGKNLGFLLAVNLAAAAARGRRLVLLNNDALVEPDTLAKAAARLDRDPGAAAVGGPILLWDGRLQEAGSIIWRDGSCAGYGRGDDPTRPEYSFVRDVDYCSGAFLMVRRALFESLGGLDTAFVPAYYEESDLCARLWERGHRIVYDPSVRVRHFEFASEVESGWAIDLQTRHRALFVSRHVEFLAARHQSSAQAMLLARWRLPAGRQRVLVIDDRVPLPWLGQGYPRAAHLIGVLAGAGHAVTHYPLQFPNDSLGDVRRALPETVEVMLHLGMPGLEGFLQMRLGHYDLVMVSRPHNMQALQRLLQRQPGLLGAARIVYDAEALFSLRDVARAAVDGNPMSETSSRALIAQELALSRGADAILTVSELEASHYRQAGFNPVYVLGHDMPVDRTTPGFEARRDFVFIGVMTADDTPNSDSLRWFVGQVWPLVTAALGPGVRVHLVGQCEAPSVQALAGPQVIVHGRVDALSAMLDRARVSIVPTRYAAGIPHKAHEAAARGLPMVVSSLIAHQLGWQDFIATGHDAQSFAQQCVSLHSDPLEWDRQRAQLLTAVERDCSSAAFLHTLAQVLSPSAGPALTVATVAGSAGSASPVTLTDDQQRTADLWGHDAEQRADPMRQHRHWASHPVTAAEINRLISSLADVGWVEHLQRSRFAVTRRRGLSLGCGSGAVVIDALRLGIVEQMEGIDISPGAVAVARQRAAEAGLSPELARFRVANVNDLALQGPFDLIVFEQSLHHVDALGPVLDQCRDALAADGWLVINEYVGPDRFQWSDEVERLMNAMLALLPEGYRRVADSGALKTLMQRVDPQAVIALDPSEAIHSGDILQACTERFECVEQRPFGGTLLQFLLADIAANFDPSDERDCALLRMMALLETELIRCGAVPSDFVYAVFRQRRAVGECG